MIRAGVLPQQEMRREAVEDCPRCQGHGEVYVERRFGRAAAEPYLTKACGACSGSGSVSADQVQRCDDCDRGFWRGEGCDHHGALVCRDCALPNCHDCADAIREAS